MEKMGFFLIALAIALSAPTKKPNTQKIAETVDSLNREIEITRCNNASRKAAIESLDGVISLGVKNKKRGFIQADEAYKKTTFTKKE